MITTKSNSKSIRVLHADDDEDLFLVAKRQIEKIDPSIKMNFISSPYDVLEHIDSYDCLILDYKMPEFDGIQLAFTIRETSDIPIIIDTGHGGEYVVSVALEAGVDDYVQKETGESHYQLFSKRIRAVVEKYRLQK